MAKMFSTETILSCVVAIAIALIPRVRSYTVVSTDVEYCTQPQCNDLGKDIAANVGKANPCEDFYQFACEHWIENHPPPENAEVWGSQELMTEVVNKRLKRLLEKRILPGDSELVKKSKTFYQSCMNTQKIDRDGIGFLKGKLTELGGWPIMKPDDQWQSTMSWEELHYRYARMTGQGALINVRVDRNYQVNNKTSIFLDQPDGVFGIFGYVSKPEHLAQYKILITEIVNEFLEGSPNKPSDTTIQKDIDDVMNLRMLLQRLMNFSAARRNSVTSFRPNTIEKLQQSLPTPTGTPTGIQSYDLLGLIKGTYGLVRDATITPSTVVVARELSYIVGLALILRNTDIRVVANHIHLYFLEKHLKFAPRFAPTLYTTHNVIRGKNFVEQERWSTCIKEHPMKHALTSIYIKRHLKTMAKNMVNAMVEDIRRTMGERIQRASWMDDATKQEALLKLQAMKKTVGVPHFYEDYQGKVLNYYNDLTVGTNYMQNILNDETFTYNMELRLIVDNSLEIENAYPLAVNSFYLDSNKLLIFVGQMLPPFFDPRFPDVINYGGLGPVVGHEMSHAFDIDGRNYDHTGKRRQWWTDSSLAAYQDKIACITNMYNNYVIKDLERIMPNTHADGQLTINENMADILGVQLAYETYKSNARQEYNPITKLKDLQKYNDDQLFFIEYANTYCEYASDAFLKYKVKNDVHSVARLRINGPLSTMPEFSQAFSCDSGTPMNPVDKCNVW